jgi:hypothetical protein
MCAPPFPPRALHAYYFMSSCAASILLLSYFNSALFFCVFFDGPSFAMSMTMQRIAPFFSSFFFLFFFFLFLLFLLLCALQVLTDVDRQLCDSSAELQVSSYYPLL